MTTDLTDFEGLPVTEAAIEIPGAAGRLRDAMAIDPREFHKGETVHVAIECTVRKVRFDPVDKDAEDGDQRRVHIFAAQTATIIDEDEHERGEHADGLRGGCPSCDDEAEAARQDETPAA